MSRFFKTFFIVLKYIFFGTKTPGVHNLRDDFGGWIYPEGLIRGLFTIGRPGSGKTRFMAGLVVMIARTFPKVGMIVMDASGQLCADICAILMLLPTPEREVIEKRLAIDIPNHPEYTQTIPEFHRDYGVSFETQIQRVAQNLRRLNPQTMELGMLGKPALEELAPELFRVLCAIENEHGETWQLTEAKKLLMDGGQLGIALGLVGSRVPEAAFYFKNLKGIDAKEREMRSYTFRSVLGALEPRYMRARFGYYRPTWSPTEAVKKSLIVLVSGEYLHDELQANHVYTQIYSLIRQEINRRDPDDPKDNPFLIVIDEAPILFKVPGLAREIGEISNFYRSRKVWLIVIVQAMWQIAKELKDQIWSFGNIAAFAVEDINDARELAEQMLNYNPRMEKQPARTSSQNPITEPEHGEYTMMAQWIQNFKKREVLLRRYFDEGRKDPFIRHVFKTPDIQGETDLEKIKAYKERIFKQRAIPIRDALEDINQRHLEPLPVVRVTASKA
jgi:hypothetical protein